MQTQATGNNWLTLAYSMVAITSGWVGLTLKDVDLSKVIEIQDNTNFGDNIACGGPNGCEI